MSVHMSTIARQMFQLQELDLALEANERDQTRVQGQMCDSPQVLKARASVLVEQKRVEDLAKQQKDAEWEVEDLSTRIGDIDKKLYGGKIRDAKELNSYQAEGEGLKKKRSGIEDKALELMEQADTARKTLAGFKDELARLEAQWQAQQKQLAADLQQLRADRVTLEEKRRAHAATMEAGTVAIYQDLRKRKGTAVAKVEQGTCRGCRIALPNSDLQGAKGGGLVKCNSCGRVLYLP